MDTIKISTVERKRKITKKKVVKHHNTQHIGGLANVLHEII